MNYRKVPFGDLATNTAKLKKNLHRRFAVRYKEWLCSGIYWRRSELHEFCKTKHSGWCKSESVQSKCDIYLNNEIERLQSENTHLKAERDKAVEDLQGACLCCKHEGVSVRKEPCNNCLSKNGYKGFEWRGLEETE